MGANSEGAALNLPTPVSRVRLRTPTTAPSLATSQDAKVRCGMDIVQEARQGLRQLNARLRSQGDDARVRYMSVEPDFDFEDESIVIVTWELPPPIGESWPLTVLDRYEEQTRDAIGRTTSTLCLFRTPDEIAETAHQRGEHLQPA